MHVLQQVTSHYHYQGDQGTASAQLGDAVLVRFMPVFWGKGPALLGLRQVRLEGAECSISKLSTECLNCTGSHRWSDVYVGDRGGYWHLPSPLFLEEFPRDLCPGGTCSVISI